MNDLSALILFALALALVAVAAVPCVMAMLASIRGLRATFALVKELYRESLEPRNRP